MLDKFKEHTLSEKSKVLNEVDHIVHDLNAQKERMTKMAVQFDKELDHRDRSLDKL